MSRVRPLLAGLACALLWSIPSGAVSEGRSPPREPLREQSSEQSSEHDGEHVREHVREQLTVLEANTPRVVFAGSRRHCQLRLRNDGAEAWRPEDLDHVAYRWLGLNWQPLGPENPARSPLRRPVPPGDAVGVNARLHAPERFGVYRLRWDVVDDGAYWLSDRESRPAPGSLVVVLPSLSAWLVAGPLAATALLLARRLVQRRRGGTRAPRPAFLRRLFALRPPARTALGIVFLAGLSVGLGLVSTADRRSPTILGDEALYTYKARNFATHGSYFAPAEKPDSLHLSAPFYSFFLAPVFLLVSDPDTAFALILLINSLLHASMIFPAFKIAEVEFPSQRWVVAAAVAVWTIPAGYSSCIMSEALFIPLFLWTGYFYLKALEAPRWTRSATVGLAVSALLLTRFNGVAMLGVAGAVSLLAWDSGRLRLARWREMLLRSPMVLVPLAAWIGLRWTRQGHEPKTIHALPGYAAKSALRLEGGLSGLVDFLELLLHQLSYLNLASFGLLTGLGILLAAKRLLGTRTRAETPVTGGRLLPLKGFFLLAALAMLAASTIYMFVHVNPTKIRFLMYGRHVDMIVPLVVIYALGSLEGRPRLLCSWRGRLAAAAGLGVHALLLRSVPEVEETRILCMGAAWHQDLLNNHSVSGWLLAAASGSLLFALTAVGAGRARAALLAAALLALNLYNTHRVAASHRFYEVQLAEVWDRLREIRASGGSVYYLTRPGRPHLYTSPKLAHAAQYFLYDRVKRYEDPAQLDLGRDWVVVGGELVPARDFVER